MRKILSVMGNMVKAALFLSIAAAILYGANFVLQLKSADGCYVMQMFEKQETDTIDVVFIGSSHIYTDVNPAVLWEEYGIAAYDLSASNQPLWNSYYYMKEAIETQSPKLVVVDLYRATETEDVIDDARIAMNTLGMAHGQNRNDNIKASIENEEDALDYILGYPVYHTRYESLSAEDFSVYNGDPNGENYKGFNENCISITAFENFADMSGVEEKLELTKKNKEYLIAMMELAEETDTELLFIVAPYQGISPSDKMIYNSVEELVRDYGVSFVDFNERYAEIGLDPMTDCAEWSHLNYTGSEKFSKYLGEYILNRYSIDDHRGDDMYASWDENMEHYHRIEYYYQVRNATDIEEYLQLLLEGEGYTVCISLDGLYDYGEIGILDILAKQGVQMEAGGIAVVKNGEILYYADDEAETDYHYHADWGNLTLVIDGVLGNNYDTVTGEETPNVAKSYGLSGVSGAVAPHGVNVLVYDEYAERYDSVGFDSTQEYKKLRY